MGKTKDFQKKMTKLIKNQGFRFLGISFYSRYCTIIMVFSVLLISVSGCKKKQPSRVLNAKSITKLAELAQSTDAMMEDKYFFVVENYVQVVKEALAKPIDTDMLQHLRTYRTQNEDALVLLENQFDDWQKNMTDEERMYFVINLTGKNATKQMRELIPQIRYRLRSYPEDARFFERMMMRIDLRR